MNPLASIALFLGLTAGVTFVLAWAGGWTEVGRHLVVGLIYGAFLVFVVRLWTDLRSGE